MLPIDKVRNIVTKHDSLEKELASGKINPKLFAQKSKEYSSLGEVIKIARQFISFENEVSSIKQTLKVLSHFLIMLLIV